MSDIAAVVAAAASNRGIGAGGDLVWRLPGDMAHFKRVTSVPPSPSQTNAVIMGRKTWESIPPKFRPLDNRLNVILSRTSYTCDNEDVLVCSSLEEAMEKLNKMENTGNVYVIGGGQVYKESLESGLVKKSDLYRSE
jgi:dihydrofolate reductase